MIQVKPATTYKEQIEKLRSKGCIINNDAKAKKILSKINYYRLSAYFLPFKNPDSSYKKTTNFDTVYNIKVKI